MRDDVARFGKRCLVGKHHRAKAEFGDFEGDVPRVRNFMAYQFGGVASRYHLHPFSVTASRINGITAAKPISE